MRKLAWLAALILAAAACGGSDSGTTTSSSAPTTSTAEEARTTTAAISDGETTTSAPATTTTEPAPSSGARFAIVEVGLDVLGQVLVQNVGDAPGSLAGHWLCQRPQYYGFPDVELQPGELAAVSVTGRSDIFDPPSRATPIEGIAEVGPFDPVSGEIGLYSSGDFGSPEAIVSYVEWGNSGHGRSGTAVSAGIWPEAGFVETTAESGTLLATTIPPTDPAHWIGG